MLNTTIRPNFDKWASHYNDTTPIQQHTVQTLATLIKTHNTPNHSPHPTQNPCQTWLDIGCGTGGLSQAVLENLLPIMEGANYPLTWYGLDNSAKMLEIFEQNLRDIDAYKGRFFSQFMREGLLSDMQAIPLQAGSVTTIISSFALHWVGQGSADKMVAELGRVLAPNGQIHVAIPVAGSLSALQARCPHLPLFAFAQGADWIASFERLIKQRGGDWLYQRTERFSHAYPDVRTLLQALKRMGGTFSRADSGNLGSIKTLRYYLQSERLQQARLQTTTIDLDYHVLIVGIRLPK